MKLYLNLPLAKRGFQVTVPFEEIVNAVLYKLKTGVQWCQLPVKSLFYHEPLSWKSVYYHNRKWWTTGVLKKSWTIILENNGCV